MAVTASQPAIFSATILLLEIPAGTLCGIDLLSFTTSANFSGIKDLPVGWHFIFTSETTSLSLRDGFWFHVPAMSSGSKSFLSVHKWDPASGSLRCCDSESFRAQLPTLWEKHLSPYRQTASKDAQVETGDWSALTKHITAGLLSHLMQSEDWSISSASCAKEDRDEIPGLNTNEVREVLEEKELGTLGIDLKRTWREGAVGRERTEAAIDRSWALNDVVERWSTLDDRDEKEWGDAILGQMEASFLMVLTVANYSCLEEWKRCIGLVLTCKRAVREREEWFTTFLDLIRKQLERCEDVEGGLFDMSDEGGGLLRTLLKGFKLTLSQVFGEEEGEDIKEGMESLETFLDKEYGWELGDEFVRNGMLQLDDGEMIEMDMEEMAGEDERGEYAPVIVELDDT